MKLKNTIRLAIAFVFALNCAIVPVTYAKEAKYNGGMQSAINETERTIALLTTEIATAEGMLKTLGPFGITERTLQTMENRLNVLGSAIKANQGKFGDVFPAKLLIDHDALMTRFGNLKLAINFAGKMEGLLPEKESKGSEGYEFATVVVSNIMGCTFADLISKVEPPPSAGNPTAGNSDTSPTVPNPSSKVGGHQWPVTPTTHNFSTDKKLGPVKEPQPYHPNGRHEWQTPPKNPEPLVELDSAGRVKPQVRFFKPVVPVVHNVDMPNQAPQPVKEPTKPVVEPQPPIPDNGDFSLRPFKPHVNLYESLKPELVHSLTTNPLNAFAFGHYLMQKHWDSLSEREKRDASRMALSCAIATGSAGGLYSAAAETGNFFAQLLEALF